LTNPLELGKAFHIPSTGVMCMTEDMRRRIHACHVSYEEEDTCLTDWGHVHDRRYDSLCLTSQQTVT
jgi:hypothetical protein